MNIIISGCGKIGYTLAESLSKENHDVVVIDSSSQALARASETLDLMCLKGNAVNMNTLREAGADKADMFIAVTDKDEINMISCLIAKKIGAKYSIARIRDTAYALEINLIKEEIEIDMIINPELATAVEISRLLRFPSATHIDSFYRGRVELVSFTARGGDQFTDISIASFVKKYGKTDFLFCAIQRGEEVFIPKGNFVIRPLDQVYIIGTVYSVTHFFKATGRFEHKVKDLIIVGGSRITQYLAGLIGKLNIKFKIIDQSLERCAELSAEFPKAVIINGDGTDSELLEAEGVGSAGAFVGLTNRDEYNILSSLYAKKQGASKVIAKVNRDNYATLVHGLGIDSILSPKLVASNRILRVVRGMENSQGSVMERLYQIVGGRAEALEFAIGEDAPIVNRPVKELGISPDVLIGAIARGSKVIIPGGGDLILPGDSLIVIAGNKAITKLSDIFRGPYV